MGTSNRIDFELNAIQEPLISFNDLTLCLGWQECFKRASLPGALCFALMFAVSASASGQTVASVDIQPVSGGLHSSSGESASALPEAPLPQTSQTSGQAGKTDSTDDVTVRNAPLHILHDQAAIWTSPAHLKISDLEWLVPLAAASGAAIATDQSAMRHVVSKNPSFNNTSVNASNAMIGGFIATPVALFGLGHLKKNPHASEAGILSGEAMIDGVVVEQGIKLMFWRERPALNDARGRFFQSGAGIDSSFPSSHSVVAWSAAAVLAGEYPSRLGRLLFYSAAAGVSVTRVMGQQHFPSDVLVGSAAGWLVGHYVFRKRHKYDPYMDDGN
jgi:PAP2 superfamily